MVKDNFSTQAATYAAFRPSYPDALAARLAALAPSQHTVWDCATGNGQMAVLLANYFQQVIATDISEKQLAQAIQKPNIDYRKESAHQSSLPDHSVDAVVIAQAIHWFPFDDFYKEVRRVVRPEGIIAALGYPLLTVDNPTINALIWDFYTHKVGPYWDAERRHLDEDYRTIPFPFEEIPFEEALMTYQWTLPTILGYLNSWSAVQHYIRQEGHNPVDEIAVELGRYWPEGGSVEVTFRIVGRVGVV